MSCKQASLLRLLNRHASPKRLQLSQRVAARPSSTSTRQWSTPLAKTLAETILTTGPVTIAQYMRQCLTSDLGGYYSNSQPSESDQFGKRGDFITSPEISQIFGELVGIWFVTEWMAQGKKSSGVQLLELGPGRGTLMGDALRTIANFKPMAGAVETIYLVESSPILREAQRKTLCGETEMGTHAAGYQCQSRHISGAKVIWVEDMKLIPKEANKSPFIVAHEFFDALPIHAFQSVVTQRPSKSATNPRTTISEPNQQQQNLNSSTVAQKRWRELLVSPTAPPSVINPPKEPGPEFELTVASRPTTHSQYLPKLSPRYQNLLEQVGSTIEVSPEARTTTAALTDLIAGSSSSASASAETSTTTGGKAPIAVQRLKNSASGAALLVDYGPADTVPINSLRGIRQHKRVSPFSSPGAVDISADVDFGALVETALSSSDKVEVHGPAEQGDWLEAMGGKERSDMLLRAARQAEEQGKDGAKEVRERLESGWKRLVERGPNGMGRLYKFLAIVPERAGKRPVGFGGGLSS